MSNDLISRHLLIEALKVHFDACFGEDGRLLASDHICTNDDIEDLLELVDNQPTIYQWIPVSERLPEFRKQVLCCNEDGRVFTSCLTKIHIYFGGVFGNHYGVIAWMPLPEPYKVGENDAGQV